MLHYKKIFFSLVFSPFPFLPSFFFLFFTFLKFYLFARGGEMDHKQQAEGDVGFPLSKEMDAGLDPRTLGSWSEPPRHPIKGFSDKNLFFLWDILNLNKTELLSSSFDNYKLIARIFYPYSYPLSY